MKSAWQSRELIASPIYYSLATSEKVFKQILKPFKMDFDHKCSPTGAVTHFLYNNDNEECAIVCLFSRKFEKEQVYALLTHEAVHIWQRIKKHLKEKNPSIEFEAYSIQRISQNLFYEYKKQVKK